MLPDREDASYVYQIHLSKVDGFIYKRREKRTASREQEGDSSSRLPLDFRKLLLSFIEVDLGI